MTVLAAIQPAKLAVGSLYVSSANEIELGTDVDAIDITTFGTAPFKAYTQGLMTVVMTANGYHDYSTLLPDSSSERTRGLVGSIQPVSLAPIGATDGAIAHLTVGLIQNTARIAAKIGDAPSLQLALQPRGIPLLEGFVTDPGLVDRTATFTGVNAQLGALSASQKIYANIHVLDTTGSGGTPSITARIESDNAGGFGTPATVVTGSALTPTVGTGASQHLSAAGPITDDFFRLQFTISGTTPHLKIFATIGVGKLTA
jgi:hypothetical protein